MKQILSVALATGFLVTGCSKATSSKINLDIQSAIAANQAAKNMNEWEMSEFNTENLFEKWRAEKAEPADVCAELDTLNDQHLALFEEEIKLDENKDLVGTCKDELQVKIEAYWSSERVKAAALQPSQAGISSSFQFPVNNQTRDVSQGYTAVKGDLAMKEVILTFDDGPHPEYTDMILAALRRVNAKAIFFTLGNMVKASPDVLRREAQNGMSIGSHSIDHKCIADSPVCTKHNGKEMSLQDGIDEILGGHKAVFDTLGWVDPFFRFPYGEYSPDLRKFLNDRGTAEFFWTIDSEDWKDQTPQQMMDNTFKQLDALGRGIILFHDIQRKTAESLPMILSQLYFKGYSVVEVRSANPKDRQVSQLLTSKAPIVRAPIVVATPAPSQVAPAAPVTTTPIQVAPAEVVPAEPAPTPTAPIVVAPVAAIQKTTAR